MVALAGYRQDTVRQSDLRYCGPKQTELHSIRQKILQKLAYVQFLLYLCSRNTKEIHKTKIL